MALDNRESKSRVASVLLAVFLSFWTWLYTYEKDAWKFWVGLGLTILDGIIFAFPEYIESPIFFFILALGIWFWAIIDVAVKKSEWYHSYPRKKVSS
jgi:hypothetical protein